MPSQIGARAPKVEGGAVTIARRAARASHADTPGAQALKTRRAKPLNAA